MVSVWAANAGAPSQAVSAPRSAGVYSSQASVGSWKLQEDDFQSGAEQGNAPGLTHEQKVCQKHWQCLQVERQNLLHACRVAVKALVDRACFAVVDDDCTELGHFMAVVENILLHGFQGRYSSSLLSDEPNQAFWPILQSGLPGSQAVDTVDNMTDVLTDLGKCRAWVRTCLVQKSLGTCYLQLLNNVPLISSCHSTSALLRRDEGHLIFGLLQALDSVDFCLCLKDNADLDVEVKTVVDYSYFIRFKSSAIGNLADEGEWWNALEADSLPNAPRDPQSAKANSIVVAAMSAERQDEQSVPVAMPTNTISRSGDSAGSSGGSPPNSAACLSTQTVADASTQATSTEDNRSPSAGEACPAPACSDGQGLDQCDGAGHAVADGETTPSLPSPLTANATMTSSASSLTAMTTVPTTTGSSDVTRQRSHTTRGVMSESPSDKHRHAPDDSVEMADYIRLQHHVSREREQRSYCEELVKQRERQLADAAHEKGALQNRVTAIQDQASKDQNELEAIILELHEKVANLSLENRQLAQELAAATAKSEGLFSSFFSR